ncbi:MAG: CvpA family protein [Lachnospiraceae bacterium]|nr:CvpA family protein [Lachnospiraceae bacterium]
MNTVGIVIGIFFLVCVIVGWARGFFRVLISVAGTIASLLVAVYFAPYVSSFLQEKTDMDEKLAVYIEQKLEFSDIGEETSKGVQVAIIDNLPLPDTLKDNILDNNNLETYDILKATGVYDYIAKSIAMVILNGAVFLVLILMCRVIFLFLGRLAKGLTTIPIVNSINRIGGAFLGAIQSLIAIWVFFLVLSITSTLSISASVIEQINDVWVLKLLYDNNVLLDIVGDLTKVLFH